MDDSGDNGNGKPIRSRAATGATGGDEDGDYSRTNEHHAASMMSSTHVTSTSTSTATAVVKSGVFALRRASTMPVDALSSSERSMANAPTAGEATTTTIMNERCTIDGSGNGFYGRRNTANDRYDDDFARRLNIKMEMGRVAARNFNAGGGSGGGRVASSAPPALAGATNHRPNQKVVDHSAACAVDLDELFRDLQRMKEETGSLAVPLSHPTLSRLMEEVASARREREANLSESSPGNSTPMPTTSISPPRQSSGGEDASRPTIDARSTIERSLQSVNRDNDSIDETMMMQSEIRNLGAMIACQSPPLPYHIVHCRAENTKLSSPHSKKDCDRGEEHDLDEQRERRPYHLEQGERQTAVRWEDESAAIEIEGDAQGEVRCIEETTPADNDVSFEWSEGESHGHPGGLADEDLARSNSDQRGARAVQNGRLRRSLPPGVSHFFSREDWHLNRQLTHDEARRTVDTGRDHRHQRSAAMSRRSTIARWVRDHFRNSFSRVLISATLVEDHESEVIVAEPVGYMDRKWKRFAGAMFVLLAAMTVLLALSLTDVIGRQHNDDDVRGHQGDGCQGGERLRTRSDDSSGSMLERVQRRGRILCGLSDETILSGKGFHIDLCRSVAAVLIGNPDAFEGIPVSTEDRWQSLRDGTVDVLIKGDTHTIEREIREPSTGAGFTFSAPYQYDGMIYFGNLSFVECAEEHERYEECSSLLICVVRSSMHHEFLMKSYPSNFLRIVQTFEEITSMLFDGGCNVAAYDRSAVLDASLGRELADRGFTIGDRMMTKEPHAFVTRNDDREFSDVVNWVLQALLHGEERGLAKNDPLCRNYVELSAHVSELDFMNAVHCVGNYGEIFGGSPETRGMNQINNGTGMLYAIPFGNLDKDNIEDPYPDGTLAKIRKEALLSCGVVVPDSFEGNIHESDGLIGMSVDYCYTLGAAMFKGDPHVVNFEVYKDTGSNSFIALASGKIDVLVGGRVQREYDFSSSISGLYFTTPYYFGNEAATNDVSFYSISTREDDTLFSSFVNCIVLATIYAQENGIKKETSNEMPLVSVFGMGVRWALMNAIAHSGSYDEIYAKNFKDHLYAQHSRVRVPSENPRGRNSLNKGGPMMLSLPHLP